MSSECATLRSDHQTGGGKPEVIARRRMRYGSSEVLFNRVSIFDVLRNHEEMATKAPSTIDDNRLLNTPTDDLVDEIVRKCALDVPLYRFGGRPCRRSGLLVARRRTGLHRSRNDTSTVSAIYRRLRFFQHPTEHTQLQCATRPCIKRCCDHWLLRGRT